VVFEAEVEELASFRRSAFFASRLDKPGPFESLPCVRPRVFIQDIESKQYLEIAAKSVEINYKRPDELMVVVLTDAGPNCVIDEGTWERDGRQGSRSDQSV
jgi:hypothetical protein